MFSPLSLSIINTNPLEAENVFRFMWRQDADNREDVLSAGLGTERPSAFTALFDRPAKS